MKRTPGLSAMLRVKNEEDWIAPCLDSIIDWFDEVVVCLQNCTDNTGEIVRSFHNSKIKVYEYEYDSWPNGEGYREQDQMSVYSRTYFYNWCLNKTTMSHVCKWDGDMVAMDWLGDDVWNIMADGNDYIKFCGINIADPDCHLVTRKKMCPTDGVFFVTDRTQYVNGPFSEKLVGLKSEAVIDRPAFLHFKWCKPFEVATQAWPKGWETNKHFQRILEEGKPGSHYNGEIPSVLRGIS